MADDCVDVRVGAVSSQIIAARQSEIITSIDETLKSIYTEEYIGRLYASFEANVGKYPVDLSPAVAAMTAAVLSKSPQARYVVGRGARTLLSLYAVLPSWIADRLSSALSLSIRDPLVSKTEHWTQCIESMS